MAISFRLPKSIPWITSQAEPGTDAREFVDARFIAVSGIVDSAKQDFDAAMTEMGQALAPIIVNDIAVNEPAFSGLTDQILEFTEVFDKTFTEDAPVFDRTFDVVAPSFSATFSETIPAFTAAFTDTISEFNKTFNSTLPSFSRAFTEAAPAAFNKTFDATAPEFSKTFSETAPEFTKEFAATLADADIVYVEPDGKPDFAAVGWEDETIYLEPELVNKVALWLTSERSAIPEDVAQQIYESAVIRVDEARVAAVAKVESDAAARGWELPSGVLAIQKAQIEREYAKGISELSASIANKDMELTQANYHKAV